MSEVNERTRLLGPNSTTDASSVITYTTISVTDSGAAELGFRIADSQRQREEQHDNTISNDDTQSEERKGGCCSGWWLCSLTHKERMVLFSLLMMDFSTNSCLSIMAPIFPQEAEQRGISDSMSGLIFAVYPLTQCLFSPVCGHLILRLGPNFLFSCGQLVGGVCSVLFGILAFMPVQQVVGFVVCCFVLRATMATGAAASNTASFAILASRFPAHISSVFGITEMAVGLGQTMGPAIGGFLMKAGGYYLPFVVSGSLMVTTVPVYIYILRSTPEGGESRFETNDGQEAESGEGPHKYGVLTLLRIPRITVVCMAVVMACLMWSILDPTLQPHLEVFHLDPSQVGLVFLFLATFYAISAPFWGWLCDKVNNSSLLLVSAFFFAAVALVLLGPSPLLYLSPDYQVLWLNLLALAILGLSASLAIVPTLNKILICAAQAGLDDTLTVQALSIGLWNSCYALGEFVGPALGGFLLDTIGFGWMTTIVAGACLLLSFIILITWLCERPAINKDPAAEAVVEKKRRSSRSHYDRVQTVDVDSDIDVNDNSTSNGTANTSD